MNHDATHCLDYNPKKCPKDCYRAQLTEELKHRNDLYYLPLSWSHLEGTILCEKKSTTDRQD